MGLREARRLSALFCGYPHAEVGAGGEVWAYKKWPDPDDNGGVVNWTPYTNAEQMKECMAVVLEAGYGMRIGFSGDDYHDLVGIDLGEFNCPWDHFPMYAAAELQRRKG